MAARRSSGIVLALGAGLVVVLALTLVGFWAASSSSTAEYEGGTPTAANSGEVPGARGSQRIVVAIPGPRSPESYLHTVALDGTAPRRLTSSAGSDAIVSDGSPAWSPDGRRVAFVRTLFEPGGQGTSHVFVAAADGVRARRVASGSADDMSPAWKPDGHTLVFARAFRAGFGLVVARLGKPGFRVLVRPTKTISDATFPAWSPDGRRIAFTGYANDNEDLYTVNADGTGLAPLLEGPTQDSYPTWSPDGARLAFTRDGDIYTMSANGTTVQPVTLGAEEDTAPQWSPDGRRLLFTRGGGRALVVSPEGDALAQVPLELPAFGATWASP
jgi:TolB protein